MKITINRYSNKNMFQLTRYLYEKEEVEYSLVISLLKKKESALFWAFELYHSGFKEELKQIIWKIYYFYYAALNRTLEAYLFTKLKNMNEEIIPYIIHNLLVRKWSYDIHLAANQKQKKGNIKNLLQTKNYKQLITLLIDVYDPSYLDEICDHFGKNIEIERKKFEKSLKMNSISPNTKLIVYMLHYYAVSNKIPIGRNLLLQLEDNIELDYNTIECDLTPRGGDKFPLLSKRPSRMILSEGRKEMIETDISLFPLKRNVSCIKNALFYRWEYYAYNTPIWKERFDKYKIKENHEQKRIEFIDDDEMEDFYNHYGYEPDEQSNEILDKSIGVLSNKKDIELYNNCKLIMGC